MVQVWKEGTEGGGALVMRAHANAAPDLHHVITTCGHVTMDIQRRIQQIENRKVFIKSSKDRGTEPPT